MKKNKMEKTFDAVKMMREIRDKIGLETQIDFEQLGILKQLQDKNSKLVGQK
ncbi:MAG: hypothetical protein IPI23_08295 [Bacteroidetes bacterium]|nr:hypothetical protein [Bacteroidota bacterium]